MSTIPDLTELFVNLDEALTLDRVRSLVAAGVRARVILDALTAGMAIVGERFGTHDYYLAELVMAAEIFEQAMCELQPRLELEAEPGRPAAGKIVIGTVKGDLHDIGKNIFVALARSDGFAVDDLGIDVPPATFVAHVQRNSADILGMSGILTTSIEPMAETVWLLEQAGLRSRVRVIVGGLPVDERWQRRIGCDACTNDAYAGLKLVRAMMEARR
ncbi:MAG TPA: cobalamin-dependent protein [Anaerolineae bacterium]|nr:cobalamin-dependent protein [Anaerolineae bacterium]HOQ99587.1 cobalamin-dependent protein [Anaerolineae bacterium]HPL28781.1 cobalamin-dependent protein [Anaerolineae bacterium]